MNAEFYQAQIQTLLSMVDQKKGDEAESVQRLAAQDYRCEERLSQEKALFRRLPLLVAHESELANHGDYLVREIDGRSWLLTRDAEGQVHALLNYCQHRGTKLEHSKAGCKKRFSCPYHAWTYALDGSLLAIPRADLFPKLDKSDKALKRGHLEQAFGFLWLTQDQTQLKSVREFVGGLAPELDALDLGSHHVYFDKTRPLQANWKFPIYAFLESYHISTLHRNSIAEFFVQNVAHSERFGPHIRSFVPRKNIGDLNGADLANVTMSEFITPTNIVFPNVCMIAHPTSYTVITMWPGEKPGSSLWRHMLLVPNKPNSESERAHYDKTIAVLDGITYEKEDFWVSEQLQQGIDAGAIDELVLGTNELMLKVFSDTMDDYLNESKQ
ncbi:aromatic ring-hydroxylating oxygenase subunit alpha [Arenicella xantha]|uniref:Phenylpropionate dioxygenase-like ring-hydroxylating dioxygenase large terminal subunit n=1 Tax=Arenicella xantha TaxID=644221 RepID=A0A395JJB7_9GAMM|nr:aromatic ring-hydroxylating dioxygenase subunit alpha [Arenicella xantha]RBP49151.1 phenylpropionate dioxygenase-like ring-hydroxylating dioxygenase large terminal subunit [Arenicella xantha]